MVKSRILKPFRGDLDNDEALEYLATPFDHPTISDLRYGTGAVHFEVRYLCAARRSAEAVANR